MIQNIIMKIYLINSSISRFINCLYCWIYISYTSHKNWKSYSGTRLALCFILRLKITVYLLSCFHSVYHSVSIVVTRCPFLLFVVTRCHSLSFIVTLCTTRFQSLSFIVSLVVIRCHSMYHLLLFFVTRCTTRLFINNLFQLSHEEKNIYRSKLC